MKDQKPFIIGLGLGVLIIAGIALTKPKQPKEATSSTAPKPPQVVTKPKPEEKPTFKPKPEESKIATEPEPTEASVMALIDAVDEPAGKIRVLTGILAEHEDEQGSPRRSKTQATQENFTQIDDNNVVINPEFYGVHLINDPNNLVYSSFTSPPFLPPKA